MFNWGKIMNAEEIIKLNKEALYSSLTSSDKFGKFFNKSILRLCFIPFYSMIGIYNGEQLLRGC